MVALVQDDSEESIFTFDGTVVLDPYVPKCQYTHGTAEQWSRLATECSSHDVSLVIDIHTFPGSKVYSEKNGSLFWTFAKKCMDVGDTDACIHLLKRVLTNLVPRLDHPGTLVGISLSGWRMTHSTLSAHIWEDWLYHVQQIYCAYCDTLPLPPTQLHLTFDESKYPQGHDIGASVCSFMKACTTSITVPDIRFSTTYTDLATEQERRRAVARLLSPFSVSFIDCTLPGPSPEVYLCRPGDEPIDIHLCTRYTPLE